ncbi:MAG: 4Fe-4S dicluster domain-containing protein [Planctomycetota bacterium]|jgi:Fe-S-cluster-containing hydrogenase component 2
MMYRLNVTPSRCIGCRTCELACAFSHPVKDMGIGKSRVSTLDEGDDVFVPLLCLQCENAACVKACPVEALVRNEKTGAIDLAEERCVLCMACVSACPFGNMHAGDMNRAVFKCDLCKGQPKCAMFCPTKALEYLPVK